MSASWLSIAFRKLNRFTFHNTWNIQLEIKIKVVTLCPPLSSRVTTLTRIKYINFVKICTLYTFFFIYLFHKFNTLFYVCFRLSLKIFEDIKCYTNPYCRPLPWKKIRIFICVFLIVLFILVFLISLCHRLCFYSVWF